MVFIAEISQNSNVMVVMSSPNMDFFSVLTAEQVNRYSICFVSVHVV